MIKLGAGDEVSNIAKAEVTFVELHEYHSLEYHRLLVFPQETAFVSFFTLEFHFIVVS